MTAWISTEEAASIVGVTSRTLYSFIDSGQLIAYRFGRVIRLKPSDVDAYIESCRILPGELTHLVRPEPYLVDLREPRRASEPFAS